MKDFRHSGKRAAPANPDARSRHRRASQRYDRGIDLRPAVDAAPPGGGLKGDAMIAIGDLAKRAGIAASALRYYEVEGLIASARSAGGRRYYPKADLRRVAFIRAAQSVGLTLEDIRVALASLPDKRTPTKADWERLSRAWRPMLDARIKAMERLRDTLTNCIGCGCLSLKACALYNPADAARMKGAGARFLLGDRPPDPSDQQSGR
jgi:MerR family redox-sensitive transcriptional activator SoxR